MKYPKYLLSGIVLLAALFVMVSCNDDDDNGPTLLEQQIASLQGSWVAANDASVTLDGQDAPGDWSNFSIQFSGSNQVSVSGVPANENIFQVSSFTLSGNQLNQFTINFNGLTGEDAIATVNGNSLVLSFALSSDTDAIGARTNSISGEWVFSLTR